MKGQEYFEDRLLRKRDEGKVGRYGLDKKISFIYSTHLTLGLYSTVLHMDECDIIALCYTWMNVTL